MFVVKIIFLMLVTQGSIFGDSEPIVEDENVDCGPILYSNKPPLERLSGMSFPCAMEAVKSMGDKTFSHLVNNDLFRSHLTEEELIFRRKLSQSVNTPAFDERKKRIFVDKLVSEVKRHTHNVTALLSQVELLKDLSEITNTSELDYIKKQLKDERLPELGDSLSEFGLSWLTAILSKNDKRQSPPPQNPVQPNDDSKSGAARGVEKWSNRTLGFFVAISCLLWNLILVV